jgi:CCDC81 eukaryotic HU domain 2
MSSLLALETDVSSADVMSAAALSLAKSGLTPERVMKTWRELARSVAEALTVDGRGVRIEGLGTFTFDATGRPVFILASEFAARHKLQDFDSQAASTLASSTSNSKLNIARVAAAAELDRSTAEKIVEAVLSHTNKQLKARKSVGLSFHPLAQFVCVPRQAAAMRFIPEFSAQAEAVYKAAARKGMVGPTATAAAGAKPTARAAALQKQLQTARKTLGDTQAAVVRRSRPASGRPAAAGAAGGAVRGNHSIANSDRPSNAGPHYRVRARPETPCTSYASSEAPSHHTPRGGSAADRHVAAAAAVKRRGSSSVVDAWRRRDAERSNSSKQQQQQQQAGRGGADARATAGAALRGSSAESDAVDKVKRKCIERGGHDGIHGKHYYCYYI